MNLTQRLDDIDEAIEQLNERTLRMEGLLGHMNDSLDVLCDQLDRLTMRLGTLIGAGDD